MLEISGRTAKYKTFQHSYDFFGAVCYVSIFLFLIVETSGNMKHLHMIQAFKPFFFETHFQGFVKIQIKFFVRLHVIKILCNFTMKKKREFLASVKYWWLSLYSEQFIVNCGKKYVFLTSLKDLHTSASSKIIVIDALETEQNMQFILTHALTT